MSRPRLILRPVERADSLDLWQWRNDKGTRRHSFAEKRISWPEHQKWFSQSLKSRDRKIYIATQRGKKVGMIRFDFPKNAITEVSINIHPEYRGRGLGRAVLKKASERLAKQYPARLQKARIRDGNPASEKIFAAAGFFKIHDSDKAGYSVWIKQKKYSSSKAK